MCILYRALHTHVQHYKHPTVFSVLTEVIFSGINILIVTGLNINLVCFCFRYVYISGITCPPGSSHRNNQEKSQLQGICSHALSVCVTHTHFRPALFPCTPPFPMLFCPHCSLHRHVTSRLHMASTCETPSKEAGRGNKLQVHPSLLSPSFPFCFLGVFSSSSLSYFFSFYNSSPGLFRSTY